MALNILAESTRVQVAAGYESGHTMVFVQNDPGAPFQKHYSANPHTQPGQPGPSRPPSSPPPLPQIPRPPK